MNKTEQLLKDGDECKVIRGTHTGKSGMVRDINTSKTGHIQLPLSKRTAYVLRHLVRTLLLSEDQR